MRSKGSLTRSQLRSQNAEEESKNTSSSDTSNQSKKIWSSDSILKAMEPSEEELEYRKKDFDKKFKNKKLSDFYKCTKCATNLEEIIITGQVPTHPCLGVLMCKDCCDYYESGEFSLDSDGEDKYCRWCGEGGTILGCSKCISGFCVKCIKKHLGKKYCKEAQENDDWLCFFCNNKPLWELRCICSSAAENYETDHSDVTVKENNGDAQEKNPSSPSSLSIPSPSFMLKPQVSTTRKRIYSSTSNESAEVVVKKRKRIKMIEPDRTPLKSDSDTPEYFTELNNLLNFVQQEMKLGLQWSTDKLKELNGRKIKKTPEMVSFQCKKIKWFFSNFSARVNQLVNSIDSLEKNLCEKDDKKQSESIDNTIAPYDHIQQFLGFINNQIKVFNENKITFSDVLTAEIFIDDNVVGIKRNSLKPNKDDTTEEKTPAKEKPDVKSNETPVVVQEDKNNAEKSSPNPNNGKIKCKNIKELMDVDKAKEMSVASENFFTSPVQGTSFLGESDKQDIQEILSVLQNA